ncbi:MAG: hypothetical protein IPQ08_07005 [Chitinophagaceae bacterium]|nr:hypothetical protein [Chitinophagaceae bacterium]
MKRSTLLAIVAFFCLSFSARSQDLGYNTKDAGLDYLWVKDSPGINLQMAFNAKIHHSIITSIGYKEAWRPIPNTHNNEKGKGIGVSLGYRYYFGIIPKGIFLGVRTHLWSMGMYKTADNMAANSNLVIAQPSAEIGYTAVVNDLVFFSFYYSTGKQFQVSAADKSYGYGKGSVSAFGISGGVRF